MIWFRRLAHYPGRDAFMVTLDHRGDGRSFCRGATFGYLPPHGARRPAQAYVDDLVTVGAVTVPSNDVTMGGAA